MHKFFNTAGPTKANLHYHINPLSRLNWDEIRLLIDQQKYFLLHAPRQTGKTSTLLEMMHRLNQEGKYVCAYANIEGAQAARGNASDGIAAACSAIARSIEDYTGSVDVNVWWTQEGRQHQSQDQLTQLLRYWAKHSPKPTILLLDEVDALIGDTLISLLRQIRAGYAQRPEAFPQAMILCGVRDIKDYRIHTKDQEIITGGSAFNIKATSLVMESFTFEECKQLYWEHTKETGQVFDKAIFPKLWSDTKGQPWLVNALAYQMTSENRTLRDRSIKIEFEHYMKAREELIQSRATHLDQLTDKLREQRVYNVISAILSQVDASDAHFDDRDLEYVQDLGLIVRKPFVHISNDIYQEVIPRELTIAKQQSIVEQDLAWYLNSDNTINFAKLMTAFQQFFRENSDSWIERFDYKEAGPQLLLQAFLQRLINGGGRINREYALGRKRTDIFVEWPTSDKGFFGPVQRVVLETKLLRANLEKTIEEGIAQVSEYARTVGAGEMHLIIFDRKSRDWEQKIWHKRVDGIDVWGC
ncbi:AAA family ATPase [Chrysiogenes arsenatis]|uniref:AAA family ATPase n=1 Tax=Chrysiogenes arsenatis TaxID=309797 RepID=UPI000423B5EA|nr:AAA family ATPase [Chrysiogenes arsenatis]